MKISAKAGVPLMELLIAIGIFAYAGILIVRLFFTANYMEKYAMDCSSAMMKAQTVFETFKASDTYNDDIYSELGFVKNSTDDSYILLFDKDWNTTDNNAVFKMTLSASEQATKAGLMLTNRIVISRCESYPFLRESRDTLADITNKQYYSADAK